MESVTFVAGSFLFWRMSTYKNQRNYENYNRMQFVGVGDYGIPQIQPTQIEMCDFIGFNYAKGCKDPEHKGVHFFLDDYQFNRLWTNIDQYIPMLHRFRYVMSPDYSMYTDFPKALQIYNHYRKHWVGAYMQMHGINVIPTICWSDQESFEWCFDGEPVGGAVAVSSVGTQNSVERKKLFLSGYMEMVERLKPTQIIFYGNVPEECKGNIVHIKQFSEKFHEAEVAQW